MAAADVLPELHRPHPSGVPVTTLFLLLVAPLPELLSRVPRASVLGCAEGDPQSPAFPSCRSCCPDSCSPTLAHSGCRAGARGRLPAWGSVLGCGTASAARQQGLGRGTSLRFTRVQISPPLCPGADESMGVTLYGPHTTSPRLPLRGAPPCPVGRGAQSRSSELTAARSQVDPPSISRPRPLGCWKLEDRPLPAALKPVSLGAPGAERNTMVAEGCDRRRAPGTFPGARVLTHQSW